MDVDAIPLWKVMLFDKKIVKSFVCHGHYAVSVHVKVYAAHHESWMPFNEASRENTEETIKEVEKCLANAGLDANAFWVGGSKITSEKNH